ncbi:MAG: hypothetical protein ABI569_04875 [Casimicrobiaceae bacterium]
MTVMRLSDGVTLGSAVTDGATGLVTIKPCFGDLPFLVTLTGNAGAKYFDESTNQLTDFGAGNTLHALVDTLDENIGVSPLTEAGYRYAVNNFVLNPQDVRAGRVPLASTGSVTGLTLAQVTSANSVVLGEMNRLQTTGLTLRTIKTLPTPIDASSGNTVLPNNRYGVAAVILGGLATMGGNYNAASQSPAILAGEQLARDLTDGKIDGFALDGSPAAVPGVPVSYDVVRLPIALNVGTNAVSERFGSTTTFSLATSVTELTEMGVLTGVLVCQAGAETSTLLKDGSVSVSRTDCSGTSATQPGFATRVRAIEGSGLGQIPRTFIVKDDGSLWGWGQAPCGILGPGEVAAIYHSVPVQIPGISNVTDIALGSWFNLARDSSGNVYSWGLNYEAELGMGVGSAAPGSQSCQNDFTSGDFRFEAALLTPTRIPTLANIVSVAADFVTGYALDRDGKLFQWGLIPIGYNPNAPPPYYGDFGIQPVPAQVTGLPKVVAMVVSFYVKMALAPDGTVWGWGPNTVGNFGDGTTTPHLTPTQVPGLTRVVEIGANGDSPFIALLQDGTIRYWGGCCTGVKTPKAPIAGSTAFYSALKGSFAGTLPPIRHLRGNGGSVLLYGVDGSIFRFPKSDLEQVFVVLAPASGTSTGAGGSFEGLWWGAPAGSESGWGINFAHQSDTIFASWFTYDLAGKGLWLVMTAPKIAPNTYSGALYSTTGPAFNAVPFDPMQVVPTQVGSGTLTFSDANNSSFAYTVNGISQTKAITRQVFGPLPSCAAVIGSVAAATNYQDLWWATPAASESGWGINFTHQGDTIFATWFTYDLDHSPMWLVVTAQKAGPRVYSGTLYRTTGPAFNAVPFDPKKVNSIPVGTATFSFSDGNNASFAYTVNGVSQSKAITREVFQNPGTVCQ